VLLPADDPEEGTSAFYRHEWEMVATGLEVRCSTYRIGIIIDGRGAIFRHPAARNDDPEEGTSAFYRHEWEMVAMGLEVRCSTRKIGC
jgi:hypothetical protein